MYKVVERAGLDLNVRCCIATEECYPVGAGRSIAELLPSPSTVDRPRPGVFNAVASPLAFLPNDNTTSAN